MQNNQNEIAERIEKECGVEAVADDGSVIVQGKQPLSMVEILIEKFGNVVVSDGVQQGSIVVNGKSIN